LSFASESFCFARESFIHGFPTICLDGSNPAVGTLKLKVETIKLTGSTRATFAVVIETLPFRH